MARARRAISAPCSVIDPRLAPLHEPNAELLLELLDLHAERGLAHRALLRGMAEMQSFSEGFEIAELTQGDHVDKACLCKP